MTLKIDIMLATVNFHIMENVPAHFSEFHFYLFETLHDKDRRNIFWYAYDL